MPHQVVKSLAEKTGNTVEDVEKKWGIAKGVMRRQYPNVEKESEQYYSLMTGILKKSLGIKKEKE